MEARAISVFATAIVGTVGLGLGVLQMSCSLPARERTITSEKRSTNRNTAAEVPTVEFCEVLKQPFRFESKVIRIKANLGRFHDFMSFYDPNCVPRHALVDVVFSPSFQLDTQTEAGKKLGEIIAGSEQAREGKVAVIVSAVGLFERIPNTADFTELQYRFTIGTVEQMSQPGQ